MECLEGLGRCRVRGENLRWNPLPKGTLGPGLEQFALHFGIHSGISFDMVFIDRNLLWRGFVEGLGRFVVRGEFLRWFPPYSSEAL